MTLYTESVADQLMILLMLLLAKMCMDMTFESLQLMPFCLKKSKVRKREILMF